MIKVTLKQNDPNYEGLTNDVVLTFDKWHQVVSVLQGLSTSALRDSRDSIEIRLAPEDGEEEARVFEED